MRRIFWIIGALLMVACAGTNQQQEIELQLKLTAAYHTQKGAEALEAGRYDEAIASFRRAAEARPADPTAADNLGVAFHRAGLLDSALAAYQAAVRLQPAYIKAYVDMGYAFLDLGNASAAESAAREALLREPNHAGALLLLGRAAEAQGRREEALQHYRRSIQAEPQPNALLHAALLQAELGDLDAAQASLQQAAALEPDNATFYFHLGNLFARKCRTQEALDAYETAVRLDSGLVGALNNRGLVLMSRGDLQGALFSFEQALKSDSTAAPALFNLSVVYQRLGMPEQALLYVERAMRCADSSAVFILHKGNLEMDLGKTEEAKRSFAAALALDPNNAMIYNNLGNTLAAQSPEEAQEVYRKALELYPDYLESRQTEELQQGATADLLGGCENPSRRLTEWAMMYANLGRAELLLGKYEEARHHLERAVALQPFLIQPYEQLALIYQTKKDRRRQNRMTAMARLNEARILAAMDSTAAALAACRRALAFDPDCSEAHAEIAVLSARAGDRSAAETAFRRALSRADDNPRVYKLHALYLAKYGDRQKALDAMRRAVGLNPRDAELRRAFADLLQSLGRPQEADEQRAWAHYAQGRLLHEVGRREAALEEYRAAAALSPLAQFIAAQGLVYAQKGLKVEAELLLGRALEQEPENALALYGFGVLQSSSAPQEAADYFRRALAVEPNDPQIHRALAEVYRRLGDLEKTELHRRKAEQVLLPFPLR